MKVRNALTCLTNRRPAALKAALLGALSVACAAWIMTSVAQAVQEGEREFKNTVPAHVPIKVKVKDEQKFKDLKNKDWARELEIEVRNTGSKPIYYLYVILASPDFVFDNGSTLGIRVAYGRKELAFIDTPLEPEDVPIPPGESITLKIRENQARGYENLRDERGADAKKIEFELQIINFGDGTGLRGKDGRPYLRKSSAGAAGPRASLPGGCSPPPTAGKAEPPIRLPNAFAAAASPARFLRANFFSAAGKLTAAPPARDLCNCQNSIDLTIRDAAQAS